MTETAIFAAGCFWGVETAFRRVDGVVEAEVGYIGGTTDKPTYHDVCGGRTGHAEACRVVFDPAVVGYDDLLAVFFRIHDPTQVNRQGPDIGNQYRSAIFFTSPEQESAARKVMAEIDSSGRLRRPLATQLVPAGPFWRAEEHHQRYHEKHGGHCAI